MSPARRPSSSKSGFNSRPESSMETETNSGAPLEVAVTPEEEPQKVEKKEPTPTVIVTPLPPVVKAEPAISQPKATPKKPRGTPRFSPYS